MKAQLNDIVRFRYGKVITTGKIVKVKDFKEAGTHYNIAVFGVVYSVAEGAVMEILECGTSAKAAEDGVRHAN